MICEKPTEGVVVATELDFFNAKREYKPDIVVYIQSFYTDQWEVYRLKEDPGVIGRIRPWIDAGKCLIPVEDQELNAGKEPIEKDPPRLF